MNWSNVELLGHHDPPQDGVDEEGQENVAQEDEEAHQEADEQLLHGLCASPVDRAQP